MSERDGTAGVPPEDQTGAGPLNRSKLQSLAVAGASWTMIHTLVSVPLAFLVNIAVTRLLGVVDYGRLAYLSTIMDVVGGLISLGVGVGLLQFGAKAHAAGRRDEVRSLLSKTQGFRLLIDVPILTLVVLAITQTSPLLLAIAIVFGVVAPAALSGAPTCLGIENKTAAAAQNAMIVNVLTQIAVLAAAFWIGTSDAVWAARLALGGVAVATALFWIAPDYRRSVLRPNWPRHFPTGFWGFAIPAGLAGVVGNLVVSRTEVLALEGMNQQAAAGLFALAFGLAGHIFAPAQALIGPLVPAVAGLREVEPDAVAPAFERTVRASATVVALMLAAAVPLFAVLVPLIYGEAFRPSAPVFVALAVGNAVLVLAGPVQAFVQARLSGWPLLWTNLIALGVDVLLMLALIPVLGIWGAVVANLTAALIRLVLLLRGELRGLELGWAVLLRNASPLALGIASCIAAWLLGSSLSAQAGLNSVVAAVAAGLLGAALLVGLVRLTGSGLTRADADAIVRGLPAALARPGRLALRAVTRAKD